MRWAIGVLLILNLTVLLWFEIVTPEGGVAGDLPDPDVGKLRLLSERQPGAHNEIPLPKAEDKPAPAQLPLPVRQQPVEVEPERKPVVQKPLPKEPGQQAKPLTPVKVDVEQPTELCWEFGNFPDRLAADTAAKALPGTLQVLDVLPAQSERLVGYYVLIPAAADMASAKATVERLKREGIRDTWLFRSGRLKQAISLGLFSKRANAEQHAKRVGGKGFEVEIQQKTRSRQVHRLRLAGRDTPLNRRAIKQASAGTARQIDCP